MGKAVYIAEKPSVAQEFAKALKLNAKRKDGYLESEEAIVTWCVGHLVTMSYPEVYDPALKKWSLNRKTKKTGLDRFADGGGDSSRDPAGKGLIRV